MSALTVLGGDDGADFDYLDVADALADVSSSLRADRNDLFDRVVLSVVLHNTDDHMRNLGVLDSGRGWRLAPVFDVNPNPDDAARRRTTIAGVDDIDDEPDGLMLLADRLGLGAASARERIDAIVEAARGWRDVALRNGVHDKECQRVGAVIDSRISALGALPSQR
jgi:serine/threonine-protein kinase HipA